MLRQVNSSQYARLQRWTERKPRLALMGEFSAGKSTLLNFLTGSDLIPTKITATQLPAIWLTKGDNETGYAIGYDGTRTETSASELSAEALGNKALIRLNFQSEVLSDYDIIDTPGISDPNMASNSLALVAMFSNFVVWCTHATQAWRQSERVAWLALPERMRKNSILLVTRTDKLKSESDVAKVRRRLERETDGLFREIVFISTLEAARAKAALDTTEGQVLWETSGGRALVSAIEASLENVQSQRQVALSRYEVSEIESETHSSVAISHQEITNKNNDQYKLSIINLWDNCCEENEPITTNIQIRSTLDLFLAKLDIDIYAQQEVNDLFRPLFAFDFGDSMNPAKVLNQIRCEVGDFSQSAWCNLVPAPEGS